MHKTNDKDLLEVDLIRSFDSLAKFSNAHDEYEETFVKESTEKVEMWLQRCPATIEQEHATDVPNLKLQETEGSLVICAIEHIESPDLIYVNLLGAKYKGKKF